VAYCFFVYFTYVQYLVPTQPPIQRVLEALSPGVKWLESEADHSPPSCAKVKNTWSYSSTPPMSSWHDT